MDLALVVPLAHPTLGREPDKLSGPGERANQLWRHFACNRAYVNDRNCPPGDRNGSQAQRRSPSPKILLAPLETIDVLKSCAGL